MALDPEEVRASVEANLTTLEHLSASSTDPCLANKVIALRDERVRENLVEKIGSGNVFRGIRCHSSDAVLFSFDCPPETICLIDPSFLVLIDRVTQTVKRIIDPFDPGESALPFAGSLLAAGIAAAPVLQEVEVTITGGFLFASVMVEGQAIPLKQVSGGRSGKASVLLTPPFVDVKLTVTGDHASFKLSIKINGKEQSRPGFVTGGLEILYQFPMSDFGLTS